MPRSIAFREEPRHCRNPFRAPISAINTSRAILDLHGKAQLHQQLILVVFHADEGDIRIGLADFGGDAG